jgi:nucleotide-binding universal stress UspA family protein
MYNRIVLAYDGSEMGQEALLGCREIAELTLAEVFLIAVLPPSMEIASGEAIVDLSRFEDEERSRYRAILDDGVKRLAALGHAVRGELGCGDAVTEICGFASRVGADLIVVGHRHREGWATQWWQASVSKSLIEKAPCNVLVVVTA